MLVRSLEEPNGDVLCLSSSRMKHLPALPRPGSPKRLLTQKEFDDSTVALIQALEELRHNDPSRYVRLQSSAALRQINDRREHMKCDPVFPVS